MEAYRAMIGAVYDSLALGVIHTHHARTVVLFRTSHASAPMVVIYLYVLIFGNDSNVDCLSFLHSCGH